MGSRPSFGKKSGCTEDQGKMSTDKSEPKVGLIFKVAIGAILTLLVLRVVLVSYFDRLVQAEEIRKVVGAKPEVLIGQRAEEEIRLGRGPLPIAQAMHQLATKGRPADFMPAASKDVAPLQGWVQMPLEAPPMMTAHPAPASSAASREGGSLAPSTAGVGASKFGDAGSPKKKP
jgi:hypothetical protein